MEGSRAAALHPISLMAQLLIIGYGSPLRGDDGIGPRIAEAAAARLPLADVLTIHQLTPELAEPVSRAGRLILVDATEDGTPGSLTSFPLAPDGHGPRSSTHQLDPEGLLALALALFGACPPATMITISGAAFEVTEELSAEAAEALPMAIEYIVALAANGH